jgi:toxin HigB-1
MQIIRSAADERDLYAMRGLRFEKLRGARQGQYSLRCNDQYRLIVELHGTGERKKVRVIEIVDYHD